MKREINDNNINIKNKSLNNNNILNDICTNNNNLDIDDVNNKSNNINNKESSSHELFTSKNELKFNLKKLFYNFGHYLILSNKEKKGMFVISFQSIKKLLKLLMIIDDKNNNNYNNNNNSNSNINTKKNKEISSCNTSILNQPLKKLKVSDIDILLKKSNAKNTFLTEEEFINFFVLLCEKIDQKLFDSSRKACINKVYKDYVYKFIDYINNRKISIEEMNSGCFLYKGMEDFIDKYNYIDTDIMILNDVIRGFEEIYKHYFHYEINNYNNLNRIIEGSLISLLQFSKDFEIVPYSINYNQLVIYYNITITRKIEYNSLDLLNINLKIDNYSNNNNNDISSNINADNSINYINNYNNEIKNNDSKKSLIDNNKSIKYVLEQLSIYSNIGRVFKFSNFIEMILILYDLSYKKLTFSDYSKLDSNERLLIFLEKLQSSKGFLNIERKTNKTHNVNTNLYPSSELLKSINPKLVKEKYFYKDKEVKRMKEISDDINEIHKNINSSNLDLRKVMTINNDNFKIIEEKIHLLKDIFIAYTRYSDKLTFMKLNYSAYLKFLKDAELVDIGRDAINIRNQKGKLHNSPDFYDNKSFNYSTIRKDYLDSINLNKSKLHLNSSKIPIKQKNNSLSKYSLENQTESINDVIKDNINNNNNNNNISPNKILNNTNHNINRLAQTSYLSPDKQKLYRQSITNFSDSKKGKLTESDASVVFQFISGPKNFHNANNEFINYNVNNLVNSNHNVYEKDEYFLLMKKQIELKESKKPVIFLDRKNQLKNTFNSSNMNRLDFYLFIKSFEILAIKLHPDLNNLDDAFNEFINNDLDIIFSKRKNQSVIYSHKIVSALNEVRNSNLELVLQMLHDPLLSLYQNYCDSDGLINFENMFEFYKNFDIFPSIVNLIELKSIFFTLSESINLNYYSKYL